MSFEDDGDDKFDILHVMPDYGGAYLWGAYKDTKGVGPNIADSWGGPADYLPISFELQEQFHQWQDLFESHDFNDSMPNKAQTWNGEIVDWDWDAYHREGLRLSKLLKQEVGDDYRVIYVTPWEDSLNRANRGIEILIDGSLLELNK